MERATAIKKLTKILGKSLGYRVDDNAPTPEERETANAQIAAAAEERDRLKKMRDTRYEAILAADAEYQSLKAAYTAAAKHAMELSSLSRRRKITVGFSNELFFSVKAEGDSWEEVIEKLSAERAKVEA